MTVNASDARHARIVWRCRRGMRELDLLLERFLAHGLDALTEVELDELERLLEQPDQDILAWLTAASAPGDAGLDRILAIARARVRDGWRTDD